MDACCHNACGFRWGCTGQRWRLHREVARLPDDLRDCDAFMLHRASSRLHDTRHHVTHATRLNQSNTKTKKDKAKKISGSSCLTGHGEKCACETSFTLGLWLYLSFMALSTERYYIHAWVRDTQWVELVFCLWYEIFVELTSYGPLSQLPQFCRFWAMYENDSRIYCHTRIMDIVRSYDIWRCSAVHSAIPRYTAQEEHWGVLNLRVLSAACCQHSENIILVSSYHLAIVLPSTCTVEHYIVVENAEVRFRDHVSWIKTGPKYPHFIRGTTSHSHLES